MNQQEAKSFKQLTISVEKLPALAEEQAKKSEYAAERARLLLGCYRTGDANDPETYVAAISATLARYPDRVIDLVTDPRVGLPRKKTWLPSVKEVYDACEDEQRPIREEEARQERIRKQLAEREQPHEKPTLQQLRDKYGPNWGISSPANFKTPDEKAEENAKAMEREQARVRAEYAHHGMVPPSKFALSMTARRLMAEQDEVRQAAE
jgi:hypothetical protein